MPVVEDLLNSLRGLIGTVETPAGSNHNFITDWYADLVGDDGFRRAPWCAMTQTYAQHEIGNRWFVYAYCPFIERDAKQGVNGMEWIADPEPGALVLYDFSHGGLATHVGAVEAVRGDGTFVTIEGNWGDRCGRVIRDRKYVRGFCRIRFDNVGGGTGTPPPVSQTGGRPILRIGSQGQTVKDIQKIMGAATGTNLTVDGDFGPATEAAVKAFQTTHGLEADGVVGPQTYTEIDKILAWLAGQNQPAPQPPPAAPTAVPGFPGTVSRGSHGDAVRQVQQRLADRGWPIVVDGAFGPGTDTIVRKFQQEKGLTVDGIVGPATWNALWASPVT
jgi:peptidoglycan hydrolase-like protein with peptidoglycan-binding domain